jgi:hypothetical protein
MRVNGRDHIQRSRGPDNDGTERRHACRLCLCIASREDCERDDIRIFEINTLAASSPGGQVADVLPVDRLITPLNPELTHRSSLSKFLPPICLKV